MSHTRPEGCNRREFLKLGALGAAGAASAPWAGAAQTAPAAPEPARRTLGRTGLQLSVVSLGAMRTSEPAIMQAAFDRGVNYVDTASTYMDGENERIVGKALRGYRDKVLVATKTKETTKDGIARVVDNSLQSLGVDHIDVLQLHSLTSADEVNHPEAREALAALRDAGKIRFVGVTTHKNEVEVLDALVADPDRFFDMVLVKYNFQSGPEMIEAIARVAAAGMGVVAMKTQAGGYETDEMGGISPHQAALKWVLRDTHVTCAIPGMVDLAQVKENLEVMGMSFARVDAQILDRYRAATAATYCRMCGACEPTCPRGVEVSAVNRCLMYAEGYRDVAFARWSYAGIPADRTAAACRDCAGCVVRCPFGLDVADKLRRAQAVFA